MADKIELIGPDGESVKDIEEIKEKFDDDWAVAHFLDGSLSAWLDYMLYEDETEKLELISKEDPALTKKLAIVFGVPYEEEDEELKAIRAAKRKELQKYTTDESILSRVDDVAFCQEDLADLLHEGKTDILLCNGSYRIPLRRQASYRGIGKVTAVIKSRTPVDFDAIGIHLEDIIFDEDYQSLFKTGIQEELQGKSIKKIPPKVRDAGSAEIKIDSENIRQKLDKYEASFSSLFWPSIMVEGDEDEEDEKMEASDEDIAPEQHSSESSATRQHSVSSSVIYIKVREILVEQLGVEPDEVMPESSFIDDLGCDSLDVVELTMAFEEEFHIEIPDEVLQNIVIVSDAVQYIERCL